MTEPELKHLIELHPDRGDLPVPCVMAVCAVESALNEWAYRYEAHYKWLVGREEALTLVSLLTTSFIRYTDSNDQVLHAFGSAS